MCKVVAVALALVTGGACSALRAQGARDELSRSRALLARAESLKAELDRRDSVARRLQYRERLARRFTAGALTVLLPDTVAEAIGERVAGDAAALLDSLETVPQSFISSRVVVAFGTAGVDSVLRAEGLSSRASMNADFGPRIDTLTGGFVAAAAVAGAYWSALDRLWRSWAPSGLTLDWLDAREGAEARRQLMAGETRVAARCLEGAMSQCSEWLGLDPEAHPYRVRYTPNELRRTLKVLMQQFGPNSRIATECIGGSDEACVSYFESTRFSLDPIPASMSARGSLLRTVRALHGAADLRRALTDTLGSVGQRLSRASGVSEDSLLAEWRRWLLTGGRWRHVTGDPKDALPVAVFGALLLVAAARSGRWR